MNVGVKEVIKPETLLRALFINPFKNV